MLYQQQNNIAAASEVPAMKPFNFFITQGNPEYTRQISCKIADKIHEFSSRKSGVTVELSALGSAIELCFKVAKDVQSKF